jgi:hypothetical protein
MATISKDVGRGDILLHRGSDERIGVHWQQSLYDNSLSDVDLSEWQATFQLSCDGDVVYSQMCTTTSDGYAWASIPAAAFTDGVWLSKSSGTWKITATNGDSTEILGWGYYEIV